MSAKNNIESIYRLTPMQQGMLFHTLYKADDAAIYLQQLTWTIHKTLVPATFQQAWDAIVSRHPSLRTFFLWEDRKEPIQIVCRRLRVPWEHHDWSGIPAPNQEARLQSLLAADRLAGFKLNQAPLLRFKLIGRGHGVYQFVWTFHHLILDGWSLPILMKEVASYYDAATGGEQTDFAAPPPYRDYVNWLYGNGSAGLDRDSAKVYWTQRLRGFSEPTPIRVDKTLQLEVPRDACEEEEHTLTPAVTAALRDVCKRHRVTLSTVVQAAWALLLCRYSGRSDVVFGVTRSGRTAAIPNIESMVGVFINTVPVRVRISRQTMLAELLKQLMADQVSDEEHAHASLADIQAWSEVPAGTALFDTLIIFENYPVDDTLQHSDWRLHDFQSYERTNYSLTLLAIPGAQLHLKLSYDAGRFQHQAVGRMLQHLGNLLAAIAGDTYQLASNALVLSPLERRQLLVDWNQTNEPFDLETPLHAAIERQAAQSPDRVAVVLPALGTAARDDQSLTYRALNERANQVAGWLRQHGVGPDVPVAICAERSLEMVVGLLGILKSGGAYVPVDPGFPRERLVTVLRDAKVSTLLTQSSLLGALLESSLPVFCLDRELALPGRHETSNPKVAVSPDNLAYVIYTSGSTGKPKGVMNTHRAICNRLLWMQQAYGLTPSDKVLQKTPFAFDVSVWEFFWPLLNGATLVMAKPGGQQDSSYLVELIVEQRITTLHFVPSMSKVFLDDPESERCASLVRVISSGEALPYEVQRRFGDRLDAQLHNLYGPTEAAVDVTAWSCDRDGNGPSVPIGWPIANTQIYILDEGLESTPIGVPGELYIGGVNLARGYLDQPDVTAENFIPNPVRGEAGARMYKTGDSACYLPDGSIQYLDRLDNQVKLRGFRIELGEIEAILTSHASVRDAAVIVREDEPGQRRLVAYLVAYTVAVGSEPPSSSELHQYLRRRLPAYSIPATFVWLASMPTNRNGKLDRAALPRPDRIRPTLEAPFIKPQTETECAIANIWQDVLQLDQVGLDDNFFELGGNSLLLIPIQSALRKSVAPGVTLVELFQYPTVQSLAKFLSNVIAESSSGSERGQARLQRGAASAQRRQIRQRHRTNPVGEIQAK